MDQIGYVVRHVTEEGFLLLDGAQGDRRNGPERRHMVGQPVQALARDGSWVDGLLAAASGHVLTAKQREEHRIGYDDFWVELGLRDRDAVTALGLHAGAPVVFAAQVRELGAPARRARAWTTASGSRAMDALLDAVAGEELPCELWLARDRPGGERPARRTRAGAARPLGRGRRPRRRPRRRRPRRVRARARDDARRRPDRRPPRLAGSSTTAR